MAKKKQKSIKFPCLTFKQGKHDLYLFVASAKQLWKILKINRRQENKDEGYQRALSTARVKKISNYIELGNPIPNSILVSFDKARMSSDKKNIIIPSSSDAGWIIDGQHRFAGAHESGKEIKIVVIAFVGLELDEQIQQFVTINREAKGVPSSLYIDLLPYIKNKKPGDLAKERAADIAGDIKRDEASPFYAKIVVTTAPKKGEISLTNFVRKVSPLILEGKGILSTYTEKEQKAVISNYYTGLKNVFPSEFKKIESIFFQTIGFGALMNALPTVFSLCLKYHQGFSAKDVTETLKKIDYFDFSQWRSRGTGSSAEIEAAEDFRTELTNIYESSGGDEGALRI